MAASRRSGSDSRRLLILACSARKNVAHHPVPAWELYDGVAFRLVKRLQREGTFPIDVDIIILSAKHGVISPATRITAYERRMNVAAAMSQATRNIRVLQQLLRGGKYRCVYLFMGSAYRTALLPLGAWQGHAVIGGRGGRIGEQLHSLKRWLLSGKPQVF
jgi:hypothetical protein